jgi:tetratricopeptide (TPR) repeat protein
MCTAAIDLMVREAAEHYQNGQSELAGALCSDILNACPDHLHALHLAAVIAFAGGRMAEGQDLLGKVFVLDPDHVPALVTLGDALALKGANDGAAQAFQRALALRPRDIDVYARLGAALVDSARFDDAASIYRSAVELDPDHVQMRFRLAVSLAAADRLVEAEQACRVVLARDPAHHRARLKLGDILSSQHKFDEAIAMYHQALAADPNTPTAHSALAGVLHRCGRLDDAIFHSHKVVESAPNDASALRKLGLILHEARRTREAVQAYQRFTEIVSTDYEIYNNLCACLIDLGQFSDAAKAADHALRLNPHFAKALTNLGVVLEHQNQTEAAIASYRRAIAADRNDSDGYANLAVALHNKGDLDEALAMSRHAIRLAPDNALIHANLAGILYNKGEIDQALAVSHQAVALAPDDPSVRFNHSYLLLTCGDLKNGFAEYRWRRPRLQALQTLGSPEWQGEPFFGRTLLVFSEQGFGDTLQFVRFLPMVAAKGGAIVLQVQAAIVPLLRNLQGVMVVPIGVPLPPFDLHVSLMDLPYVFGTTLDSIPAKVPYLFPDPEKAETWRRDLRTVAALKVGVVWAGSPTHKGDRNRSLAADALLPRLVMPGVQLYSLQKEPRAADAPVLARLGSRVIDLAPRLNDFSDTAAAIVALDLVISVDTSVAHLAGALGGPTWVLLSYAPDWRWLRDRNDTPWYPNMLLLRQEKPQVWESALTRVSDELARRAAAKPALSCGQPTPTTCRA